MKYAVQYAYEGLGTQIPIDTSPISKEEAIKLFNDSLEDFKTKLANGMKPQLVIWEDVGDGEFPIYSKELVELDWRDDLKERNGQFYKTVELKIELP